MNILAGVLAALGVEVVGGVVAELEEIGLAGRGFSMLGGIEAAEAGLAKLGLMLWAGGRLRRSAARSRKFGYPQGKLDSGTMNGKGAARLFMDGRTIHDLGVEGSRLSNGDILLPLGHRQGSGHFIEEHGWGEQFVHLEFITSLPRRALTGSPTRRTITVGQLA